MTTSSQSQSDFTLPRSKTSSWWTDKYQEKAMQKSSSNCLTFPAKWRRNQPNGSRLPPTWWSGRPIRQCMDPLRLDRKQSSPARTLLCLLESIPAWATVTVQSGSSARSKWRIPGWESLARRRRVWDSWREGRGVGNLNRIKRSCKSYDFLPPDGFCMIGWVLFGSG